MSKSKKEKIKAALTENYPISRALTNPYVRGGIGAAQGGLAGSMAGGLAGMAVKGSKKQKQAAAIALALLGGGVGTVAGGVEQGVRRLIDRYMHSRALKGRKAMGTAYSWEK